MSYSKSTIRRAEQILGYGITDIGGVREFTVIDGVINTDLFEGDPTITGITDFKKAFNGRVGGTTYFNQIILTNSCKGTVEIDAIWGSCDFNDDISGLLEWLEENPATDSLDTAGVKSLKIEDFSQTSGTAEETQADINTILHNGYGFYVRRPVIFDVSSEHRHDHRYF